MRNKAQRDTGEAGLRFKRGDCSSGRESEKGRTKRDFSGGVVGGGRQYRDNADSSLSTLAKLMVRVGVRGLRIVFMPFPLVWARLPEK